MKIDTGGMTDEYRAAPRKRRLRMFAAARVGARCCKYFFWVIGSPAFLLAVGICATQAQQPTVASPNAKNPYLMRTFVDGSGRQIDEIIVPGRPPEKTMPAVQIPPRRLSSDGILSVNTLNNVPAFKWCYGCAATSAGMLFGYYDNLGFVNMYAGAANGGVCPMNNNATWGSTAYPSVTCAECPFIASHQGIEGRGTRGHVDDYWIDYGNAGPDPFIAGSWTEHSPQDCTADFMGTSKSSLAMEDGATSFSYYTDGTPLYDNAGEQGCHGMHLFAESRGYQVVANFNQYIYGYGGNTLGFTFAQYQAEIDAGRPVLIQVTGHTMVGFGYDTSGQIIYIHDTWDNSSHTMTWGATYSGLQHYGVAVVRIALNAPTSVSATDGSYTDRTRLTWSSAYAPYYRVYRATTSNGTKTAISGWQIDVSFDDTTATPGARYYYWVTGATDASGSRESAYSTYDIGWVALSAPTVTASDGTYTNKASVNWGTVNGASYYRVYRAPTAGGAKTTLGSWTAATNYNDTTASPGVTYYYSAQAAVDSSGTRASTYSAEDSGWRALSLQTITAGKTGNGTISPEGAVTVAHNGTTNFLMSANHGNHIANIKTNGNHIADSPYSGNTFTTTNYVWSNIVADGTITVAFAVNEYILTVVSAQGGAYPGTQTTNYNAALAQFITNSPVSGGAGTQYVCVAGTVASNACTQVSPTNITLNLTNNATLTWNWKTKYAFVASNSMGGYVVASNGWYDANAIASATAYPSNGWQFAGWVGDIGTLVNPLALPMDRPYSCIATFTQQFYTLTGSAVGNGTISPLSTNVPPGGSAVFDVTADRYYRIFSLKTNGMSVGPFDNNSTATNFTWSNVQATGAIASTFTAQVANNPEKTPYWWLAQYGLTNGGATFDAAAVADLDHDGLNAWQEYIAGTDPTNAASVLKILSVTSDGVSQTVKWLNSTGAPNYNLLYSTNLQNAGNGWTASSNNIARNPPTNSVTITPPGQPVFYKITVTN